MASKELVSIIITTRNEEDVLPRLLDSIRNQSYTPTEIILVDNNSTDKTLTVAKKFTSKVFTYGPERSAQRNKGAKAAKGKYLLFLDADMELDPHVIKQCVSAARSDSSVGAVVIPEISTGNNFWEKGKAFERSFYEQSLNFSIDSARFFKKSVFFQAGGYDELITGPEDWDLSESVRKLGVKVVKTMSPITHQERIPSLLKHSKKFFYYGLKSHRSLTKQNQGLISSKTIPFLRPEFAAQWKRIVTNPFLTLSMIIIISSQIIFGGAGFIWGKFKNL